MVTGSTSKVNKAFGVTMRAATLGSTRGYAAQGTPSVPSCPRHHRGLGSDLAAQDVDSQRKANPATKRRH